MSTLLPIAHKKYEQKNYNRTYICRNNSHRLDIFISDYESPIARLGALADADRNDNFRHYIAAQSHSGTPGHGADRLWFDLTLPALIDLLIPLGVSGAFGWHRGLYNRSAQMKYVNLIVLNFSVFCPRPSPWRAPGLVQSRSKIQYS